MGARIPRAGRRPVCFAAALGCALALDPAAAQVPAPHPAVLHEDAAPAGRSLAERMSEIRRRIQAALVYPPAARRQDVKGEALVGFEIAPSGRAHKVAVVRSSGHAALDAAAARAVNEAGALPWVYGPLEVPVRFELRERRGARRVWPDRRAP